MYPRAATIRYSCTDDPPDVVLWSVHDSRSRPLWDSDTADDEHWPALPGAVDLLAAVELPQRGDGLVYRLAEPAELATTA